MKRLLLLGVGLLLAGFLVCCSGGWGISGTKLEVHFLQNGSLYNAFWPAFQDGDSAWKSIHPSSTGIYHAVVHDTAGRYGFAVARPGGNLVTV